MPRRKYTLAEIKEKELVKISELAELTGVRYPTLTFYANMGLLPFQQKENRRARYFYREACIARLQEIEELKKQRRSIAEIVTVLVTNEPK